MTSSSAAPRYRLAVVNSHPIQYFAPLYQQIAQTSDIDIMVYYCSSQGMEKGFIDPGFGKEVIWDLPLLEGYPHKFLPALGRDRGVRGFFSLVNPSVIQELWTGRYDAVLVHGHNFATNLLAMAVAKFSGSRLFMRSETHLLLRRSAVKRVLRGPLMRFLYALCDACLYIGTRNRDFYRAQGVPERKLFFVPYTVDNQAMALRAKATLPEGDMRRRALGIQKDVPIVLYASKLSSRKRPIDVVRAIADLHRRGAQAALLIVGDGEQRARLESEATRMKLTSVAFTGFVNQRDLPSYYAIADAFVLPSEDEPWGLAINEAMACGVPVVTTREVGAAADLVLEGETGYTYETGDITALADALEKVLMNRALQASMRRNCVARMSTWGYAECIKGLRSALHASAPRTMHGPRKGSTSCHQKNGDAH